MYAVEAQPVVCVKPQGHPGPVIIMWWHHSKKGFKLQSHFANSPGNTIHMAAFVQIHVLICKGASYFLSTSIESCLRCFSVLLTNATVHSLVIIISTKPHRHFQSTMPTTKHAAYTMQQKLEIVLQNGETKANGFQGNWHARTHCGGARRRRPNIASSWRKWTQMIVSRSMGPELPWTLY